MLFSLKENLSFANYDRTDVHKNIDIIMTGRALR